MEIHVKIKKKMKINKIIAFLFLAVLATGCSKDENTRIRIFAEQMTAAGGGSKVLMDPAHINAAEWVAGEKINLNGTPYTIGGNTTDGYSLDLGSGDAPSTFYALYPASIVNGGNDIEVTNNGASASTVLIHSLAVNFRDGKHDVYFPMKAQAASDATSMTFQHLTAGLKLTLTNGGGSAVTLSSVKVVLVSADNVVPMVHNGVSTSWANFGMSLPTGIVGVLTDDIDVRKTSELNVRLKNNGTDNVTIAAGGSLTFCIPVTVTSLTQIAVAGYDASGAQRFVKGKALGNTAIDRNKMYYIPAISF